MKACDILTAAKRGYVFTWEERAPLARLAIVPFFVRALCNSAVFGLGFTDAVLWERLILLPALFSQGWFMAVLVRRVAGQKDFDLRALQASMVAYVLIDLLVTWVSFGVLAAIPNPATAKPSAGLALAMIAGFAASVWAFRLIWLHIPIAMGVPWRAYIRYVKGMEESLFLLAVFLMVTLPASLVFMGILDAFLPNMSMPPSPSVRYALEMLFMPMELILLVLATSSMTYGIITLLQKKET